MRKIIYLSIFILGFVTNLVGQNMVLESEMSLDFKDESPKKVIVISNKYNSGLALFFRTKHKVLGKFYNTNNIFVNATGDIDIPKKTRIHIGYHYEGNLYTLYFSNKKKTKFSTITINLDNRDFNIEENYQFNMNRATALGFITNNDFNQEKNDLLQGKIDELKNINKYNKIGNDGFKTLFKIKETFLYGIYNSDTKLFTIYSF